MKAPKRKMLRSESTTREMSSRKMLPKESPTRIMPSRKIPIKESSLEELPTIDIKESKSQPSEQKVSKKLTPPKSDPILKFDYIRRSAAKVALKKIMNLSQEMTEILNTST